MRLHTKQALTILGAICLLALVTSAAAARMFSITEQRFRISWSALNFNASVGTIVSCPITLAGSFHRRSIPKTEVLVGAINGASISNASCTGGSATLLTNTLPWHMRYVSFSGTLPAISGIRIAIAGVTLQVNIGGTTCLVRTDAAEPFVGELNVGAGGATTTVDADAVAEIDLEDDRFLCAFAGDSTYSGRASVANSVGGTVSIRLI